MPVDFDEYEKEMNKHFRKERAYNVLYNIVCVCAGFAAVIIIIVLTIKVLQL